MHVPAFPSMCLFTTEFSPPEDPNKVLVRFALDHTFDQPGTRLEGGEVLEVPLRPETDNLKHIEYKLHGSPAQAYIMPEDTCKWFSDRFGFEVRLNYIGMGTRAILGNVNPNAPRSYVGDPNPKTVAEQQPTSSSGWLGGIKAGVGNILGTFANYAGSDGYAGIDDGITFADVAAFLVISYASFKEVETRVEAEIEVEKFRPNIVVDGVGKAWAEDHWSEISIGSTGNGNRIAFTSNCARCASLNVDYDTGKAAQGPKGNVLKSMQRDRRIDPGYKFSPIFGRYGFLSQKNGLNPTQPIIIKVGDEVSITRTNERTTHFCKYNQYSGTKYKNLIQLTNSDNRLAGSWHLTPG